MDYFNLATILISLGALALSGYSLWLQKNRDKREEERMKKRERKNLKISSHIAKSTQWAVTGGKTVFNPVIKLEITNDSEMDIHIEKIEMEFYSRDLLPDRKTHRSFNKNITIPPGIKKTEVFKFDRDNTFPLGVLEERCIKFLISDTLGTIYSSKIICYDISKFVK